MATIEERRKALIEQELEQMAGVPISQKEQVEAPISEQTKQSQAKVRAEVKSDRTRTSLRAELGDYASYRSVFCVKHKAESRISCSLNRASLDKLRYTLSDLRENLSLSAYIDNILMAHLETYDTLLKERIKNRDKL